MNQNQTLPKPADAEQESGKGLDETTCSRLTGREPWLVAGLQGETIWANDSYRGEWWWPIVFVEMDTGLIKIDVCGKTQNWHLDDVARIRIGLDEVIEWEDFFNTPENIRRTATTMKHETEMTDEEHAAWEQRADELGVSGSSVSICSPCPFCGNDDSTIKSRPKGEPGKEYYAYCHCCEACGPPVHRQKDAGWNLYKAWGYDDSVHDRDDNRRGEALSV